MFNKILFKEQSCSEHGVEVRVECLCVNWSWGGRGRFLFHVVVHGIFEAKDELEKIRNFHVKAWRYRYQR